MAYEPPVYPSSIPSQTGETPDMPDAIDDITWWVAAMYNGVKRELCAIMAELGTLPKGSSADVKTRLDTLAVNPMSAAGDMIIGGASGVPARLAVAAANLKLFMNAAGNAPEFAAGIHWEFITRNMAANDGDVSYTGAGFKPSLVIAFAVVDSSCGLALGIGMGLDDHKCIIDYSNGGAINWSWATNLIRLNLTVGNYVVANFKSADSSGCTLTWGHAGTVAGTANAILIYFR